MSQQLETRKGKFSTVLPALYNQLRTNRETLTHKEQALLGRICKCAVCEHLWLRRINKIPQRCPRCVSLQWDLPLLRALYEEEKAKQEEAYHA